MKINWKSALPHVVSVLFIILINFIYFQPQFKGKVLTQSDMIQVEGMQKELQDFNAKSDESALWSSMFSGMPAFQIYAENQLDYMSSIFRASKLYFADPAGTFIMGMLFFYLSFLLMGINPWLSLIGAVCFGFGTNNLILYQAGHITKVWTVMSGSLVLVGAYLIANKKYLIGGAVFAFGLAMNLYGSHIQMSYYLGLTMIPFFVAYLIKAIKDSDYTHVMKAGAILLVGGLLAIGTNITNMWDTYDYGKQTMRGKPILEAKAGEAVSTSTKENDGLEWEYAMQWSNGVNDVIASVIPNFVGGGSGAWLSKDSYMAKQLGQRKDFQAPTYWGDLPFTSGPTYLGIGLVFLFLFGAFAVRGALKWWLVSAVLMTIFISMGKNFELFNRLMFDYFPLFSKFRSPNSVISVTAILLPFLGIYALSELIKAKDKNQYLKPLYISSGIIGGLSLIFWILGGSIFDFSSAGDEQYANIIDILREQRVKMMATSSFKTLAMVLIIAGAIWAFIKSYVNKEVMLLIIGLVSITDLYVTGKSYFSEKDFVSVRQKTAITEPRQVDLDIMKDPAISYRVYDGTVDVFQSAMPSYFHKSVGGYHAAKLQRYQDLITNHLSKGNQKVFDMLNTKYFIFQDKEAGAAPMMQMNPNAMGNAWFVKGTNVVESANAEIDSLNTTDLTNSAVVHKEFAAYIVGVAAPDSTSKIVLTAETPNKLDYDINVNTDALAVFSEIWYGPDLGWNAYIDGKPVDHIRVNYALRGLKIPAGQHKVVFEFRPRSHYMGQKIGLACTMLMVLLLVLSAYIAWKNKPMEPGSIS